MEDQWHSRCQHPAWRPDTLTKHSGDDCLYRTAAILGDNTLRADPLLKRFGWTDLKPGGDVKVLLHVSTQHLAYGHSSHRPNLLCTHSLLLQNNITHAVFANPKFTVSYNALLSWLA